MHFYYSTEDDYYNRKAFVIFDFDCLFYINERRSWRNERTTKIIKCCFICKTLINKFHISRTVMMRVGLYFNKNDP